MADPIRTVIDTNGLYLDSAKCVDDTLTLAGADTIAKGTILARDSVSDKLVLFVKGGSANENGIPKAVLTHEVVAAGAGDSPVRVAISGTFRKSKLIIDADGDASNIDAVVEDQMRDYSMLVSDVGELGLQDNPQP